MRVYGQGMFSTGFYEESIFRVSVYTEGDIKKIEEI